MEHLQNENEQKRKMLDEIHKENCMLEENVMKHEEDEISLNGQFHNAGNITKLFSCDICGEDFQTQNDLKLHDKIMHKTDSLKNKEKELLEQRLDLMKRIFI